MKFGIKTHCAALFLLSCGRSAAQAQTAYSISGRINEPDMEGRKVYLTVYDTNQRIDSAVVQGHTFHMKGTAPAAYFARVDQDNMKAYANLILEDSVAIDFNTHLPASGGPLTRMFLTYQAQRDSITDWIAQSHNDLRGQYPDEKDFEKKIQETRSAAKQKLYELYAGWIQAHGNDGIGYAVWQEAHTQAALDCDLEALQRFYSLLGPALKSLVSVQKGAGTIKSLDSTAVGQPFCDVEGLTAKGQPVRLSDYAGKGKFVLVDFWASWCDPCREEGRETLKPLWERYKDNDKLAIVGVAVWDKQPNTLEALSEEGYSWPQIIGTGMKPMEQYGIIGIPHILLIGPDGTILARGLRGASIELEIAKHTPSKQTN